MSPPGLFVDLGRMGYEDCHRLQNEVLESVAGGNLPSTLLTVEHNPVLSLGAAFQAENLLFSKHHYAAQGIEVVSTDRGGDITFHGPRQLVAYPIFNLRDVGQDLHKWLRNLEETVIRTLAAFGLEGYRFPPHTGVWVNGKKICAIGIKVRRWVSKHGIALNCDNDLSPFDLIVPCGIKGYGITSIAQELGPHVSLEDVRPTLVKCFQEVFGFKLEGKSREELLARLHLGAWGTRGTEVG